MGLKQAQISRNERDDKMDFKLGCQTLPYSELPLERALEGIAQAGYEYLCFGTTHQQQPVPDPTASDNAIEALGRQVRDAGLTPIMAFMPTGGVTGEGGLDMFKKRLDHATILGLDCLLAWGPFEYESWPGKKFSLDAWREITDAWFTAMQPVMAHAEAVNIPLVFKPHTGLTAYGNVLRQTIERLESPMARACYDGGNVHYYEGLDPALDINDCADLVSAICVKDHVGLRANPVFPVPGGGDVDHAAMLEALKPFDFKGPVVVERFEGPFKKAEMIPELIDALAAQALVYLKGLQEAL